jgi:uncharacterized protein
MALVPDPSPLGAPYWDGAAEGQLLIQRCERCGHVFHPPLPVCPSCHSTELSWQPASGRGKVFSFTIVHIAAHPALAERVPYVAALIELEEGPRMVANMLEVAPENVRIDMPVKVQFVPVADGIKLPQFVPA